VTRIDRLLVEDVGQSVEWCRLVERHAVLRSRHEVKTERCEAVAELTAEGMSPREIGDALCVGATDE
jgi:hypothetical protein